MSEPADYEAALDIALDAFMRDKHRGEWDASSRDDMRRAIAAYHAAIERRQAEAIAAALKAIGES